MEILNGNLNFTSLHSIALPLDRTPAFEANAMQIRNKRTIRYILECYIAYHITICV